jgi:MYXO-CTERM domain-containing protein
VLAFATLLLVPRLVLAADPVGVPVNGFPSYQERLMLAAINRARADPNNVPLGTASMCSQQYPAQKPLMLNLNGSHAARFHTVNTMINHGGLSHNSYCTLRPDIGTSGCDGSDACACMPGTECFSCMTLGGCGTDPFTRASYFGYSANGEVGAAGNPDGFAAVAAWVGECAGQDGHRSILTSANEDEIGLGYAGPAMNGCWSALYFGDTGFEGVSTAVLPSGAHAPEMGSGPTDLWAAYFSSAPAASVDAVVDGHCNPMSLELGSMTNGTFKVNVSIAAGCHQYWFLAKDASGNRSVYPEVGAYGAGACSDYVSTAMGADCEGATPMDAGPAAPDAATSMDARPSADAAVARDAAPSADATAGEDAMIGVDATPEADAAPHAERDGGSSSDVGITTFPGHGCGCSAADARPGFLLWALGLAIVAALRRRGSR